MLCAFDACLLSSQNATWIKSKLSTCIDSESSKSSHLHRGHRYAPDLRYSSLVGHPVHLLHFMTSFNECSLQNMAVAGLPPKPIIAVEMRCLLVIVILVWQWCRVGFQLLGLEKQRELNAGNSPDRVHVQLVSRHWINKDEHGVIIEEVKGPGVIGKYPELEAGSLISIISTVRSSQDDKWEVLSLYC